MGGGVGAKWEKTLQWLVILQWWEAGVITVRTESEIQLWIVTGSRRRPLSCDVLVPTIQQHYREVDWCCGSHTNSETDTSLPRQPCGLDCDRQPQGPSLVSVTELTWCRENVTPTPNWNPHWFSSFKGNTAHRPAEGPWLGQLTFLSCDKLCPFNDKLPTLQHSKFKFKNASKEVDTIVEKNMVALKICFC